WHESRPISRTPFYSFERCYRLTVEWIDAYGGHVFRVALEESFASLILPAFGGGVCPWVDPDYLEYGRAILPSPHECEPRAVWRYRWLSRAVGEALHRDSVAGTCQRIANCNRTRCKLRGKACMGGSGRFAESAGKRIVEAAIRASRHASPEPHERLPRCGNIRGPSTRRHALRRETFLLPRIQPLQEGGSGKVCHGSALELLRSVQLRVGGKAAFHGQLAENRGPPGAVRPPAAGKPAFHPGGIALEYPARCTTCHRP